MMLNFLSKIGLNSSVNSPKVKQGAKIHRNIASPRLVSSIEARVFTTLVSDDSQSSRLITIVIKN